jgi:hypothetical protein
MMNLNDEDETTLRSTPRSKLGYKDMNSTPLKVDSIQYIQYRIWWHYWNSKELEMKRQEDF